MTRRRAWMLCAFVIVLTGTSSRAGASEDIIAMNDASPLSVDEMDSLRGGFVDPTGMLYQFAVDVRTTLNGIPVFSRSVVVAPSQLTGELQAMSTANVNNAAPTVNVNAINNGRGVNITDAAGNQITAINQTAAGAPTSIILNTTNNQSVTQTVDLSLILHNTAMLTNFIHNSAQGAASAQRNALRSLGF